MTLHIESFGSGKPLVMLHGWGMHGGIWGSAAEQLAEQFRVYCVDLPGYGQSRQKREQEKSYSLDSIVAELSHHFNEPVNVCGWSLGGQIALHWVQHHPNQINNLIIVASTPCFVQRPSWPCAIASTVLQEFAQALEQDFQLTLRRFIALQVRGSENERELLQTMRKRMAAGGEPDMSALRAGLEILRDTDLRNELAHITQQTLIIAGERDTLTPPAASAFLAQALPHARLMQIRGAAHAPFLSHPDEFVKQATEFLKQD